MKMVGALLGQPFEVLIGTMFDRLLIAVDGSDESMKAAELAVELAETFDSDLQALFVTERYPVYTKQGGSILAQERELEEEQAFGQQVLDEVGELAASAGVSYEGFIRSGPPSGVIVNHADDEGADAIVMGKQGRQGLTERFTGSTTERVVREVPISVFTVS